MFGVRLSLRVVHSKSTPKGLRYRLWSMVSERYATEPLTGDEMRALLLDEARRDAESEVDEAMARAATTGTSRQCPDRHPSGEWNAEKLP